MEDGERVRHEAVGIIVVLASLVPGAHFVVSALEACLSAEDRAQEIFGNLFKIEEVGVAEGSIGGGN